MSSRSAASGTAVRAASIERLTRSVGTDEPSFDGRDVPPRLARHMRQPPLGEREQRRPGGGECRLRSHDPRLGDIGGDQRKGAPREGEPDVGVDATTEELEVVRRDEERAERDQRHDPERGLGRDGEPDDAGRADGDDGETDERPRRDPGAERSPAKLVERVRADPHREREREHREAQTTPRDADGEATAHDHVGEVPRRVGKVEQRHVVAPTPWLERVEGGSARGRPLSAHAAPPDDEPAAEAEPASADVLDPGGAPELEQPRLGIPGVKVADRVAEKPSHLVPAR